MESKMLSVFTKNNLLILRPIDLPTKEMGYSRKNPPPPQWMGSFFNPPSHLDFLKHKIPAGWISKTKDPPPAWISVKKILGLNLIFFM